MVATRPSTMSCWDGRSGSISWIERVPSELRTASTLATCLADTQADSDDVPAGQRGLVGSGLASKFVLEVAVAVKVPRLGEVMVTVLALRLTMPVKSSSRSSWLEKRLLPWRGSVKPLRTLLLLKFTASVLPEMDTALAKLRSMPMPVTPLGETVKDTVATGLLEAATLRGQMVAGGQPEIVVLVVSFRNVILALPERVRVALLY